MTRNHFLSRPQNLTSKKVFRCVKITGEATSVRERKKRCGSNYLKATNTGSGWARRWNGRKFPCIFMIPTESSLKSQMDGKRVTSRPRTSFQKQPAAIL